METGISTRLRLLAGALIVLVMMTSIIFPGLSDYSCGEFENQLQRLELKLEQLQGQEEAKKLLQKLLEFRKTNTSSVGFLLEGPTGVGKSFTTSLIASSIYFNPHNNLLVIKEEKHFSEEDEKRYINSAFEKISAQLIKCPNSMIIMEAIDTLSPPLQKKFQSLVGSLDGQKFGLNLSPAIATAQANLYKSKAIIGFISKTSDTKFEGNLNREVLFPQQLSVIRYEPLNDTHLGTIFQREMLEKSDALSLFINDKDLGTIVEKAKHLGPSAHGMTSYAQKRAALIAGKENAQVFLSTDEGHNCMYL